MDNDETNKSQTEDEKTFAELLAESRLEKDWLQRGQKIEAKIVKITKDWVFLDLGGKSEGYLDRKELLNADGHLTVKEGDTIQAYFLSSQHNEKLFTTRVSGGDAARTYLEDAWKSGIPVEGVVEKETKGGFEIKIAGTIRGFCPYSQMGLARVDRPDDFVGKRWSFIITEYGEKGRNLILSHRAILEEEQRQQKERMKALLKEGMSVKGIILSVHDFGAFMDVGGLQGLLPISEIGWGRVANIHDTLAVGQSFDVVITKLDWEKDRITLSVKETLPDPWEKVVLKYPEGSSQLGVVARLTKIGAFVTLESGIDGLVHISKLAHGKRIKHPSEILKEGQTMEVRIEKIDREKKRLSLTLAGADDGTQKGDGEDYRNYLAKANHSMGSLGDLLKENVKEKSHR
jgi:small subunit ribosomal protein S1